MKTGYFAGLGSGRGWIVFNFILTPEELQKVFDGLKYLFVNTNSRVESDYTESSKQNYFQAYKNFFEQILIGQQSLNRQDSWNIERPVHESIIDDISKVFYRELDDKAYKMVEPLEPLINITPFYLQYLADKDSLSVAYLNEKGIIGLQLQYPKYVTWYDTENPKIIETNSFESFTLFKTLVERIKKQARKAKVQSPTKLFKPNFWISESAVLLINKNKYLQENGFEIK
jgi:hypothetical protein